MSEAASDGRKLLIVGAHSGDFVWRAAGAMAAATSRVVRRGWWRSHTASAASPGIFGTSRARRSRT